VNFIHYVRRLFCLKVDRVSLLDLQRAWRRFDGPLPEGLILALLDGGAAQAEWLQRAARINRLGLLARDVREEIVRQRAKLTLLATALDERLLALEARLTELRTTSLALAGR